MNMNDSSFRWREARVREEIYKDLKDAETSAHRTGSPALNGTTVTVDDQARPIPPTKPARNKKNKRLLRWILLPLAILAVGGGVRLWVYLAQFESTDDAYITGHEHPVSFRVSGTISEVLVDDNQLLKRGDPIARLDPRDYEVALAGARASLDQAKAQLAKSQAQQVQADAQLNQARAQAEAARAQRDDSQRNFQRDSQLFYQGRGVISKQDLDNAQYQFQGNEASYNAALAATKVAEANLQTAKAQEKAAGAQVEVASAQVKNAELQLSYTTVYAPTDGRVSQKTFEVGQQVQAGQAGLSIAEPGVWVLANFKENQLGRIRPGNRSRSMSTPFRTTPSSARSIAFRLAPEPCTRFSLRIMPPATLRRSFSGSR